VIGKSFIDGETYGDMMLIISYMKISQLKNYKRKADTGTQA
jgi:hypothetical protein